MAKSDLPAEPDPSLLLDLVADVSVLRTALAGLLQVSGPEVRRHVGDALDQLAHMSRQAGALGREASLLDQVLQRRLGAFEMQMESTDCRV